MSVKIAILSLHSVWLCHSSEIFEMAFLQIRGQGGGSRKYFLRG